MGSMQFYTMGSCALHNVPAKVFVVVLASESVKKEVKHLYYKNVCIYVSLLEKTLETMSPKITTSFITSLHVET